MFRFASLVLLVVVVGESMAQVWENKSCPSVDSVENFEREKLTNITWYMQQQYYYLLLVGGRCAQTIYSTDTDDTNGMSATMKAISNKNNQTYGLVGTVSPYSPSDPADMRLTTDALPLDGSFQEKFIATDYKTYLINWGCNPVDGGASARVLFVSTAEQSPSEEVLATIANVLKEKNIDTAPLIAMSQSDCSDISD